MQSQVHKLTLSQPATHLSKWPDLYAKHLNVFGKEWYGQRWVVPAGYLPVDVRSPKPREWAVSVDGSLKQFDVEPWVPYIIVEPCPTLQVEWYGTPDNILSLYLKSDRPDAVGHTYTLGLDAGRDGNLMGIELDLNNGTWSVCAPEDPFDFETGCRVALAKTEKYNAEYYAHNVRCLDRAFAAIKTRALPDIHTLPVLAMKRALNEYLEAERNKESIIPAELQSKTFRGPADTCSVTVNSWDSGTYITVKFDEDNGEFFQNSFLSPTSRREAFAEYVRNRWSIKRYRTDLWEGYFKMWPEDRR